LFSKYILNQLFCKFAILKHTNIGKLFKYIGIAIVLNIIIKPAGLIIENIIQDHMGHEAFGTFAALNALSMLFIVLLDLGVNQFLTKELAADHTLKAEKLATFFSLKILLALIYPLFMIGLGFVLGYAWDKIVLLFFISIGYSFFQLTLYLRAKFQALQKYNLDSIASVTDKFFLILFSLILLFTTVSITSYVGIRLVSTFLTLLVLAVPAWQIFSKEPFQFKWQMNVWKDTLKQTYPFALITILYSIHDKID